MLNAGDGTHEHPTQALLDLFTIREHFPSFEGLRLAMDRAPDIILTDVIMPYMDGPEMLDRLRSRPETREIPVIAITALTDRRTRSRLTAVGVRSFLAKPYTMRELAERIREALPPASWGEPATGAGKRPPSLPPRTRR